MLICFVLCFWGLNLQNTGRISVIAGLGMRVGSGALGGVKGVGGGKEEGWKGEEGRTERVNSIGSIISPGNKQATKYSPTR